MSFQFCLAFVFLGRKRRLGCMPWLMLQFPIFFFSTSLSALRLCEGRSQVWGCTFSVGWLSGAQRREEGEQLCSLCSPKCCVSH